MGTKKAFKRILQEFFGYVGWQDSLILVDLAHWLKEEPMPIPAAKVLFFESDASDRDALKNVINQSQLSESRIYLQEYPDITYVEGINQILYSPKPYNPIEVKLLTIASCARLMKFKGDLFILIAKNQGFTSVTEYVLSFCRKVEVIAKIGGFRLIEAGEFYRAPPEVKEQEFLVDFSFRGKSYRFKSKKGVFADNKVDSGTKLLLDSADIRADDHVFDVGCGYGIIGIVAASLAPKGKALLVDSNVKAANLARSNIEVNNIKNADVATEDLVKTMTDGRFSLVLSNPPQHLGIKQVASLWSNVRKTLENEAKGFIVIQEHLSRPYERILSRVFPKVEEVITDGQYCVFEFHQ